MPQLANHQSAQSTKLLLLGDSGAGKTGALASLAAAGYNLRVIDLDAGLDVLANILRDPKSIYGAEALARVEYVTLTDPMKAVAGKLIPAKATVWQRAINLMDNWKVEEGLGAEKKVISDLGPVSSWGERDVLVIDSFTFLCKAALNFVLSMNARLGQQPHQSDWYAGQQMVESLLQKLYDEGLKCNIIVIGHITYVGEENGPQKGYPASLGKALNSIIGRYFNNTLMVKTSGTGSGIKRKIITNSTLMVELKNSAPTRIKPEYDLERGLAEIFKDLRGGVA